MPLMCPHRLAKSPLPESFAAEQLAMRPPALTEKLTEALPSPETSARACAISERIIIP
jgi:hypothetical protein